MKTAITCQKCFFAFNGDFFKPLHTCPSCGYTFSLWDEFEAEYKADYEKKNQEEKKNDNLQS